MYLFATSLTLVAAILLSLTVADPVPSFPACGTACTVQAAGIAGCVPNDFRCLCKSVPFLNAVQECEAANCSVTDLGREWPRSNTAYTNLPTISKWITHIDFLTTEIGLLTPHICLPFGGIPSTTAISDCITAPNPLAPTAVVAAASSILASQNAASSAHIPLPTCPCLASVNALLGVEGCQLEDPDFVRCRCTNSKFQCPLYQCETAHCSDYNLGKLTPYDLECAPYYGYKSEVVCAGDTNSTAVVCPPAGVVSSGGAGYGYGNGTLSTMHIPLPFTKAATQASMAPIWVVEAVMIVGCLGIVLMWL